MSGKYVEIEIPYGEKSFYCPVCGGTLFDESKDVFDGSCRHLLFSMNEDAGVFDRIADRLAPKLEQLEDAENWKEWFVHLPDTSVVFCIYEPGRGGGHQTTCNYYCIDFRDDLDPSKGEVQNVASSSTNSPGDQPGPGSSEAD